MRQERAESRARPREAPVGSDRQSGDSAGTLGGGHTVVVDGGAVTAPRTVAPRLPGPVRPPAADARPRRTASSRTQAWWAFAGYLGASLVLFGIPILPHFTTHHLGIANRSFGPGLPDPSFYMWSFAWWPHAIAHGLDPFYSHAVWAPTGYNIAWTTSVPGAALLIWPVTDTLGVIAAYNVWMLLAPALAGWAAFLLCRQVTRSYWPSVAGGFLFGFSSYELTQMSVHLDLALIFVVPLTVYLVLRRLSGEISVPRFVTLMTLLLILQFSFFLETFFTMTFFGVIVYLIALPMVPPETRRRMGAVAAWTGLAYAITAVVVSPYLYAALAHGGPPSYAGWPARYSSDLANFVFPTKATLAGAGSWFQTVSMRFKAGLGEEGAFFGLLLVVAVAFAWTERRTLAGKLLPIAFVLVAIATLGPIVVIDGTLTIPGPWRLVEHLSLFRNALPARFVVYAWLAVALMAAIWLAHAARGRKAWLRWGVVALSAALIFPNLTLPLWHAHYPQPALFADGTWRNYVEPGENVLMLPAGSRGFSMFYQAQTDFAFNMETGYLACEIPPEFARWPIMYTLLTQKLVPDYATELKGFLAAHRIGTVIIQGTMTPAWSQLFRVLRRPPESVDGVTVYRGFDQTVAAYRSMVPDGSFEAALSHKCS